MRFLNTTSRNSRGLPCTVVLNAFSTGALTPEEAVSGAHRCGGIDGRGQTVCKRLPPPSQRPDYVDSSNAFRCVGRLPCPVPC